LNASIASGAALATSARTRFTIVCIGDGSAPTYASTDAGFCFGF
jgi:hypothetical protein